MIAACDINIESLTYQNWYAVRTNPYMLNIKDSKHGIIMWYSDITLAWTGPDSCYFRM